MSNRCLFDDKCSQIPKFQNNGKKDALELEDSFSVNGEWMSLEKFFSYDLRRFKAEVSPKERLQYMKDNPEFKYRNDPKKGEFITIAGKELRITPELTGYIDKQDKLYNDKVTKKASTRNTFGPGRYHDFFNDSTGQPNPGYEQIIKLSSVPNPLRALLRSVGLRYLIGKTQ